MKLFNLTSRFHEARIKPYELNSKPKQLEYEWLRCLYNVTRNLISTEGDWCEEDEDVCRFGSDQLFEFSVRFDERLTDKSLLLKIAQDRWARYKYEHSDEEETNVRLHY